MKLQARILLAVVGPLAVLLALEVGLVAWQVRAWRLADLDRAVAARAVALAGFVEYDHGWEAEPVPPEVLDGLAGWRIAADGRTLAEGGRIDGRVWRGTVAVESDPGPPRPVEVTLATDPGPVLAELDRLLLRLVLAGLALTGLGAGLGVVLSRRIVSGEEFQALRRAWERQAAFTADAAHELRTPLATIRSEAEVALRRPREAAAYREALEVVAASARRVQRTLDGLLALARAGEAPAWTDVDLAALAREAAARHADPGRVPIEVEAPPRAPARADPRLLDIALDNLLANALRHAPEGRVRVAVAREDGGWRIAVEDTGEGIAPEHLPHVFDRFYRVDPGRSRHRGGSGLGLAIVRVVAERHGGRATIFSRPGEGTRVTLHLPPGPAG